MTLAQVLAALEDLASPAELAALARYGIPNDRAVGVAMRDMIALGKTIGQDHALATKLWADGRYEARTMAAFVDDPAHVTDAQMDAWVADFDNWAICDTLCFRLFDRAPGAWGRIEPWAASDTLYTRRAAFALIWSLAAHDKTAGDDAFLATLPLARAYATDARPHVTKAISMAMRTVGKRNATLNGAVRTLARDLTAVSDRTATKLGRQIDKALG